MSEALTPGAMAEKLRRGPDYAIIYGNAAANMLVQLADVEAELQQMREERTAWRVTAENAEKDAARYRWLLANYARGDGYDAIDQALNDGEPDTQLSPAIDAAISAAMKETP